MVTESWWFYAFLEEQFIANPCGGSMESDITGISLHCDRKSLVFYSNKIIISWKKENDQLLFMGKSRKNHLQFYISGDFKENFQQASYLVFKGYWLLAFIPHLDGIPPSWVRQSALSELKRTAMD